MTTWGSFENNCRLGLDLSYSGSGSSVTVYADFWFQSNVNVIDSSNVLNWSGDQSGSKNPGMSWSGSGSGEIHSISWTKSLVYGSTQDITLNAWITGVDYVPDGRLDVSATVTLPARPYQLPRPPQSPSVTKNSDTSATASWTTDYTDNAGGYPWHQVYVERWDNVTASWYQIATVSYGTTSYTDTTIRADRQYRYRVRAWNTSGYSTYATTGYIYTTPAAHTNLAWAKNGTDVVLTWSRASTMADVTTDVQESTDSGSTWTTKASVVAGMNTWTHTNAPTNVTHIYRIRPVISSVTGAWTVSTVVQLLAAPLAPTNLTPSGTEYDNATSAIPFAWTHNPADGTSQTAYEVSRQIDSGSWTSTGKVVSTASSYSFPAGTAGNGHTVNWKVRTWGQHANAGDYSAVASFPTGARPVATITSPTTSYGKASLTITWTYYDAESSAQSSALVELLDAAGAVLHAHTVQGAGTSYSVPVVLTNTTAYSARVTVRDGGGQWSLAALQPFTTAFVPPPTPLLAAVWDLDTGTMSLTIQNTGVSLPAEWVDPISNEVWRSLDSGTTWERIATGLPLDTTMTDYTPLSAGLNQYRAVAVSATPSSASSSVVAVVTASPWVFVNGGPNYSVMAKLKGGVTVGLSVKREKVLHQFAGRRSPVEFLGTARARELKVSGSVDGFGLRPDRGNWEDWEAIADLAAPLVLRDPLGRRDMVSISEVDITHETGSKSGSAKVAFNATVVEADS